MYASLNFNTFTMEFADTLFDDNREARAAEFFPVLLNFFFANSFLYPLLSTSNVISSILEAFELFLERLYADRSITFDRAQWNR